MVDNVGRASCRGQMKTIWIVTAFAILSVSIVGAQEDNPKATALSSFSVRGVVIDSEGAPLIGAEVFAANGDRAISDASGEFVLNNITDRSVSLFIRRIGYTPVSAQLAVETGVAAVSIRARLDKAAVTLGTVVIEGRTMDKELWDKGFYKRMNDAMAGTFFTPERLAHGSSNVSTLIGEVPRVRMTVGRGGIAVPKAPYKGTDYCTLSAVIDGVPFSSSLVDQVGIDNLVNVTEVKAIEVYLTAGRIPNVLAGRGGTQSVANGNTATAGAAGRGSASTGFGGSGGVECGTIVVWTKGR